MSTNGDTALKPGDEIKAMEHPTLKVPYEVLNKRYRVSQKVVDREVSHLSQTLQELKKSTDLSQVHQALNSVVENLQVVKRKADESMLEEERAAQVCKRRLDHLKGIFETPYNDLAINVWKKKRLDRLLVDHLLRDGYYETAAKLTQHSGLENLANVELFMVARRVESSLENGDTSKCLAWCHENKSKLRKLKSTLEVKLRQQEYIELVRQNRKFEAIYHVRKYLTGENTQRRDLEQIMGLLAQPLDTQKEPYRDLLDKARWKTLIEDFKRDNYNLFQLNSVSVFSVVLQAGLSALKTPPCYKKSAKRNPDCPVCSPILNELAKRLPYPFYKESKLFCPISGEPMVDENSPMMLPNGNIYGELSLKSLANNQGRVVCPRTQQEFRIEEALKTFVV